MINERFPCKHANVPVFESSIPICHLIRKSGDKLRTWLRNNKDNEQTSPTMTSKTKKRRTPTPAPDTTAPFCSRTRRWLYPVCGAAAATCEKTLCLLAHRHHPAHRDKAECALASRLAELDPIRSVGSGGLICALFALIVRFRFVGFLGLG